MSLEIEYVHVEEPATALISELPAGTYFCYELSGKVYIKIDQGSTDVMHVGSGSLKTSLHTGDVYILKCKLTVECVMQ